jgi:hypothetical protein
MDEVHLPTGPYDQVDFGSANKILSNHIIVFGQNWSLAFVVWPLL